MYQLQCILLLLDVYGNSECVINTSDQSQGR
jgi:hypothetical protein